MSRKQLVAEFISANPSAAFSDWEQLQRKCPQLRLKTVGPKHDVQISFQKGEWFDPNAWLANYKAGVLEGFERESGRLVRVFSQEEIAAAVSNSELAECVITLEELNQALDGTDFQNQYELAGAVRFAQVIGVRVQKDWFTERRSQLTQ